MKVIDCFPYFNEEEHLILRINLLKDHVDKFVICEANRTHTGNLKEYTVEQVLKQNGILLDKIYIHKVELPSTEEEPDNWVRERKQRDEVAKLIKEEEMWFISDCDEILNPDYLQWYKKVVLENPNSIVRTRMTFHVGEANFQVFYEDTPLYWDAPFFVLKKHTDNYTLSEIREGISWNKQIDFPSIFLVQDNKIIEAGWHLSWMGSSERRVKKLESFMHYNDFIKNGIGYLHIEQAREYVHKFTPKEDSVDILGRENHTLRNYDTSKLPNLIFKNKKLKDFFIPHYLPNKFYTDILQTDSYSNLLQQYINNPESDLLNFYLAVEYDKMGQTAAAISFYLRAAERTDEDLLKYECLLRASMCFDAQGSRGNSVIGLLQHAVSLLPKRPEAYFLLSRYYERTQKWFEGYMLASIGEKVTESDLCKLRTVVDYPGYYGLLFEKAVTGWWCGLCEESLGILKKLSLEYIMDSPHKTAVVSNLKKLGGWKEPHHFRSFLKTKEEELEASQRDLKIYTKTSFNKLKFKFKDSKNIERNYSEAFQDMFVLTLLDGKREGYYLEVGAGFPFYGNNTYLLESEFEWKGVSIDVEKESIERHFEDRKNQALLRDATKLDYKVLFKQAKAPSIVDYLQLDCDPPSVTYDILTKIPFKDYKFRVITYEHDYYQDDSKLFKEKSRTFLKEKGYKLLISNVSTDGVKDFEDWWIHPDLVTANFIEMENTDSTIKTAKDLFLK